MARCRSFRLAGETLFRATGRTLIATGRILNGCLSLSIPTVPQTVGDACAVFLRWLVIVGCWPELGDDLVSYYDCSVDVHRSARKHGVAEEDAIHAAEGYLVAYPLSDDDQEGPRRELRLGPDRAGNLLEIVVLLLDDGDELVIHAMRMRPKYGGLLP